MRTVWVTANHPHPEATGGSAHEYELIRALSARHDIHLITSNPTDPSESALLDFGVTVERITFTEQMHPTNRIGMAWAMLRAEPTLNFWLLRSRLGPLSDAVRRAETARRADLVHVTHGELAPVLAAARAPTSLLLFDSYVRQKSRELELETLPRRRLKLGVERWRARRWEQRWYAGVTGIAAVSPDDAAESERLLGRPVAVLPNPVPDEFFEPPTRRRHDATVTFVGSLLYGPNLDAVRWLVNDIWPRVIDKVPTATLRVVGRSDGDTLTVPKLQFEVERVGGTVEVDVPDIRASYWEATVVVAPMRLGSGLRNKVIHAMACGAPVVATPQALEGVAAVAGTDVLTATTAEGVADGIVELLRDPSRAAAVAAAGSELAARFHSAALTDEFERWWCATSEGATS